MPEQDVGEKYNVPPYKVAEYTQKAQRIVSSLLKNSSVFLKPYTEAKIILELAMMINDRNLGLFEYEPKFSFGEREPCEDCPKVHNEKEE